MSLGFHVGTPNGWKPSVLLEELGLPYKTVKLDIMKNETKGAPSLTLRFRLTAQIGSGTDAYALTPSLSDLQSPGSSKSTRMAGDQDDMHIAFQAQRSVSTGLGS